MGVEEWIERCRRMKCIGFVVGWDVDSEGEDQDGWSVDHFQKLMRALRATG